MTLPITTRREVLEKFYGVHIAPFTSLCDRCGGLIPAGHVYDIYEGRWQHPACPETPRRN
ncbi:hypothetical protein SEA_VANLEE_113 [Gordonia phage VanLee]|uniref:Uncharacterized protein n=1 Tax=Gordonia phage VanLee TaxID=2845816 RepID=A0A8F2D9H9_9CAUD|nr:hypothetical protein QEH49_gp113 [Gordonia phage VanLee]QWS68230.1 hypothetical protein SEA_VANLEE_113 [Gordonia phage VanLee]